MQPLEQIKVHVNTNNAFILCVLSTTGYDNPFEKLWPGLTLNE